MNVYMFRATYTVWGQIRNFAKNTKLREFRIVQRPEVFARDVRILPPSALRAPGGRKLHISGKQRHVLWNNISMFFSEILSVGACATNKGKNVGSPQKGRATRFLVNFRVVFGNGGAAGGPAASVEGRRGQRWKETSGEVR